MIEDDFSSDSDDQLSPVRSVNHIKVLLMFLTIWQFAFNISNSAIKLCFVSCGILSFALAEHLVVMQLWILVLLYH